MVHLEMVRFAWKLNPMQVGGTDYSESKNVVNCTGRL